MEENEREGGRGEGSNLTPSFLVAYHINVTQVGNESDIPDALMQGSSLQ